jgi:hypothetical protein
MEVLTLTVVCHERRPPAYDIFLHPVTRDGLGSLPRDSLTRGPCQVPPADARDGCRGNQLLRVPLLIEDRDAVALELKRLGINVFFVYAPPLDDYAGPELCEPSPLPEAARWWAAHILPVDPHDADRLLGLVAKKQLRLTPALPPRLSRDGSPLGSF